jgi:hypothetical protein
MAGSSLALIWLHARKNRIVEIQNISLESILLPAVFVISIMISIINIQIAFYF